MYIYHYLSNYKFCRSVTTQLIILQFYTSFASCNRNIRKSRQDLNGWHMGLYFMFIHISHALPTNPYVM